MSWLLNVTLKQLLLLLPLALLLLRSFWHPSNQIPRKFATIPDNKSNPP